MDFTKWSKDYETGNGTIDAQHKRLFYLIKDFFEAHANGEHHLVVEVTLDELNKYTSTHFKEEEALMKDCNYPGFKGHVKLHLDMVVELEKFKFEYEKQSVSIDVFLDLLKRWFANHILVEDMKIKPFLKDDIYSELDHLGETLK